LNVHLDPTRQEAARRREVLAQILEHVRSGRTIKLPAYDPELSRPSETYALQWMGIEPNPFGGLVGPYRYQFEGEDDLLHLMVTRSDGSPISVAEAQQVAGFLLDGVPAALVWLRAGELSHHFYCGHDELLTCLKL
jgi:hypothetical protein